MKTSALAATVLIASAAAGPAPVKRASLPTVSIKGNGQLNRTQVYIEPRH